MSNSTQFDEQPPTTSQLLLGRVCSRDSVYLIGAEDTVGNVRVDLDGARRPETATVVTTARWLAQLALHPLLATGQW